jgi:SAM-dependent methyltransferase
MNVKSHWEKVFTSKAPGQVSWHQDHLSNSLALLRESGLDRTARIIDAGSGDSTFVDDLLELGFRDVTVLDVSQAALQRAKDRLGERAQPVTWIQADLLSSSMPTGHYDLWHDRAFFHFLLEEPQRQRYVQIAREAVKTGGFLILATFAIDGPEGCSGLKTRRYSPESLLAEFGPGFELLDHRPERHLTPGGLEQRFLYCLLRKIDQRQA